MLGVALIAVILAMGIAMNTKDSKNQEEEKTDLISFPYVLEDGRLKITSLFQSDIPNPDNDYEEGKNLASLELVNESKEYLESADISVLLQDGTKLEFQIKDIPSGKTVWAFELENIVLGSESACKKIECKAKFASEKDDWSNDIKTSVEGSEVTIQNLKQEDQKEIQMTFHCLVEGVYFGGTSYEYDIDKISANESINLSVIECYFGDAELVSVDR